MANKEHSSGPPNTGKQPLSVAKGETADIRLIGPPDHPYFTDPRGPKIIDLLAQLSESDGPIAVIWNEESQSYIHNST